MYKILLCIVSLFFINFTFVKVSKSQTDSSLIIKVDELRNEQEHFLRILKKKKLTLTQKNG